MQDLNDLYYFAKVVEHGGFTHAARVLGIPKSKLSRRVATLEERLGTRLIQRSTRRLSVTEIGKIYWRHCQAMLVEAEAAQEAIDYMQATPRGIVRVSCPVDLLQIMVRDMLVDFMCENPAITLHLEATNRRVDIIGEGLDLAIRVRRPPLEDSDLVFRVLSRKHSYLVASPSFLSQHPMPTSPDELDGLPSLGRGSIQDEQRWELESQDQKHRIIIRHNPHLVTDNMVMLRAAALAGLGIVQLPWLMVDEAIGRGDLVRLLPDWNSPPEIVHVVYPSRRGQLPAVSSLLDFLSARFKES